MRKWVAFAFVLASSSAGASATNVLPPESITALKGCWQAGDERWIFRAKGGDGLEVVREVKDASAGPNYAERARIPQDVRYEASTHTYGFSAAGPIHALLFLFTRESASGRVWLSASSYASGAPGSGYRWTGSKFEVRRCP